MAMLKTIWEYYIRKLVDAYSGFQQQLHYRMVNCKYNVKYVRLPEQRKGLHTLEQPGLWKRNARFSSNINPSRIPFGQGHSRGNGLFELLILLILRMSLLRTV